MARFSRGVVAFCARASGEPSLAEDLAQEVFVRAWSRIDSYRAEFAFSTWLYRIALNLCRDHRRKRRVRPATSSLDPLLTPPTSDDPSPLELAERAERTTLATEALDRLDDRDREIVVLHAMSGLSFREIARALDLPPTTAKNRFAHALRRLRRWLGAPETHRRIESKELA